MAKLKLLSIPCKAIRNNCNDYILIFGNTYNFSSDNLNQIKILITIIAETVNLCQSWLILCYFQIVCQEFFEYLQNSYSKEHLWLNSFDFYVLTVPERSFLSCYIDILVFSFHCLSIGFIVSAMDFPSSHRLEVGNDFKLAKILIWFKVSELKSEGGEGYMSTPLFLLTVTPIYTKFQISPTLPAITTTPSPPNFRFETQCLLP